MGVEEAETSGSVKISMSAELSVRGLPLSRGPLVGDREGGESLPRKWRPSIQERQQQDDNNDNRESMKKILSPAFGRPGTVMTAINILIHDRTPLKLYGKHLTSV